MRTYSAVAGWGNSRAGLWVLAWEATVTFCGVAVAMPQGQSWAPPSASESQRTWVPFRSLPVSTLPAWWAGWVHRRPIGLGRGGAVVVLGAGESLCTGGKGGSSFEKGWRL